MTRSVDFIETARRKMDIQILDSHLIYSVIISRYVAAISKIMTYLEIIVLDAAAEYLDIATKYTR